MGGRRRQFAATSPGGRHARIAIDIYRGIVRTFGDQDSTTLGIIEAAVRSCFVTDLRRKVIGLQRRATTESDPQERTMSHQPPKENKKKPRLTPKEKKLVKQQKKHASDAAPFIKR
jgi:hypothetical protein